MEQLKRGAGRETLASAAASPAQIGPHHGSTAQGQQKTENPRFQNEKPPFPKRETPVSSNAAAYAPADARAYARRTRAEIERDMEKALALQNEYRAARGAELAAKCADWMDANPDALRYIERRALEEAGAERRFSVRLLLEEARRKDFTDRRGCGTRINNVIAPALARRIVEAHPEVRPFVKLRRSMVDEIEG